LINAKILNIYQKPLSLNDFDYVLPTELIAQFPQSNRSGSRLLHIDSHGQPIDRFFIDLTSLLKPNDLLVFNNTRVIKARLHGRKATGGVVEVLIERVTGTTTALAHVKASKTPPIGTDLILADAITVKVMGRSDDLFDLSFDQPVLDALDHYGEVPLPPYIQHSADDDDAQRYQTVYAKVPGAVAAPTAGLHFDEAILEKLQASGVQSTFVTLHVGAGTFQPVRDNDLSKHIMHSEWYTLSPETVDAVARARQLGGRVIAVGTTSVRALESSAQAHNGQLTACSGDTQLFIQPGFNWQIVDAMVTNFHLPQSTLLMLVSAFIGLDTMKAAYAHAIESRYRFFSYGDAMFLEKGPSHAI
jgi:S-adenosylmethionine:tRNA ribosyltransferase-isomerase